MFSFVRWYIYFQSVKDELFYPTWLRLLNRTFNLSPHESNCTIALITIHHVYTILAMVPHLPKLSINSNIYL